MTRATLSDLSQALLASAHRAGADAADCLVVDGTSVAIDVRNGVLEQAERSEQIDLGLRVFVGQRQACVSASDTNPRTLEEMAARAVAMAEMAPEDPYAGLADADQLAQDIDAGALDLFDETPAPSPAEMEEIARQIEARALDATGISQVESASVAYGSQRVHLATSVGFSAGYQRSSHVQSCVAITGEGTGMERDYAGEMRIHRVDLPPAAETADLAAQRTLARAGARKPPTGAFPVLYDERIASSLIGHLVSATNGSSIVRGASWLRDALGEDVLPKGLSLIEDPLRPRIYGSRPFDGEGLASRSRAIVSDGVLQGWTLDLATARQLGQTSTANGSRGTQAPPSPSVTNLALSQGPQSRADLIAQMGTGLLVTSLIGSSINPNTGDYSRGASGFWVENGEITYPVNECTIAGNLRPMLRGLIAANDGQPHKGRIVPSLLVEGLTIAGA